MPELFNAKRSSPLESARALAREKELEGTRRQARESFGTRFVAGYITLFAATLV